MTSLEAALIRYGIHLLASRLGQNVPQPNEMGDVGAAIASIDPAAGNRVRDARLLLGEPLDPLAHADAEIVSIFSLVGPAETVPPVAVPLQRLSFEGFKDEADRPGALFERFLREIRGIRRGLGMFESACSLLSVYAWSVPATLTFDPSRSFDPKGLSLWEQFKAVTALAHCLEHQQGGTSLLLVSGDLPGIQAMLYTITSRGAAKSLRGRSLYLQLLSDVVIRNLLATLNLPWASVIYNAGGNFKLLAPAASTDNLIRFRQDVNKKLLKLHGGELYVALAWEPIPAEAIIDARGLQVGGSLALAMDRLSRKTEAEKARWFAEIVAPGDVYDQLFGPVGSGGPLDIGIPGGANACLVCHADVTAEDRRPGRDDEGTYCLQCWSFEELAGEVGRSRYLRVQRAEDQDPTRRRAPAKPPWDDALKQFGFSYELLAKAPRDFDAGAGPAWLYRIDSAENFLGQDSGVSYGIRPVANLTPWQDPGNKVQVRDIDTMANKDATGIRWYGVLRMDVDGLGNVFQAELRFRDLLHTSALSGAVTLFFEGYLNAICRKAAEEWRSLVNAFTPAESKSESETEQDSETKTPYIIYAGGDDLFIVGCWDVLPVVAQAIRNQFGKHTSSRLTMSAGIALGHNKFPLYQAAELAKRSLDRSKARKVVDASGQIQQQKDAITFLGMPVGWEQFKRATDLAVSLSILIGCGKNGKRAPRALLNVLGTAALAYRQEVREAVVPRSDLLEGPSRPQSEGVMLGKWFWRLSYGLLRLAVRTEAPVQEEIIALNGSPWESTGGTDGGAWAIIDYLGLPVRWAELLIRKEG